MAHSVEEEENIFLKQGSEFPQTWFCTVQNCSQSTSLKKIAHHNVQHSLKRTEARGVCEANHDIHSTSGTEIAVIPLKQNTYTAAKYVSVQ